MQHSGELLTRGSRETELIEQWSFESAQSKFQLTGELDLQVNKWFSVKQPGNKLITVH